MRASRYRWVAATAVVCGSALIGVRLGTFLTQVMRAGDRPRAAAEGPGRATAARPNLRSGIAGVRPRFRTANTYQFPLNGKARLPVIHINPPDLPAKPHFLGPQPFGTPKPLPSFDYQITADSSLGGDTYTGTILGSDPSTPGYASTKIPVQIIPLIISVKSLDDGKTVTYDPTVPDSCAGGHTQVELVQNSPLFQKNHWDINGVDVGNTQYLDAFQRAQFWSLLNRSGKIYHLILDDTLLDTQTLSFSGHNLSFKPQPDCADRKLGLVDINDLDTALYNLMTGPLAGTVNPGTFPIFLMKNVVAYVGEPYLDNCCILGYHGAFLSGPDVQIYSPFDFETTGAFGPGALNTAVLSHELGEAINDPTGGNPTPPWGNVGQDQGGCQNNFEVGDPLTGTSMPPVVGPNGFTYNLQELAFISWFYGGTAPLGAGGVYSSNGTFQGIAKLCPPGGTN
jgi:hypothetical protein